MIERWLAPAGRRSDGGDRRDESFECSNCPAAFDEWTEDCPQCGQLVVRVVELPR